MSALRRLAVVALAVAASACAAEPQPGPAPGPSQTSSAAPTPAAPPALPPVEERLATLLTGTFDSSAQAARDEAYFDVSLAICPVASPLGERVLYVEQALSSSRSKPYRQRLYVIERAGEGAARSRVLELTAPARAVGACGRAERPTFAAEDAKELVGCAVEMRWVGDHFEGRTGDQEWSGTEFLPSRSPDACKNDFQGASYATSQVSLHADRLESWDRGYDGAGRQVWGATRGGYVFVRR
jgi:hypothetical protein